MMPRTESRNLLPREAGFTLLELLIAVVIFVVIAAIALPVYLSAQRDVGRIDVKTGLTQVANLITAEKADNNQLYPTYMPNEVLANEQWRKYAYTYSDDRATFCLQGEDQDGQRWYVSTGNLSPSQENCGQPNIGERSATPWHIGWPDVAVSDYSIIWSAATAQATASATWAHSLCGEGVISYQLHLKDTTRNLDAKFPTAAEIQDARGGLQATSYTAKLADWLPGDQTVASVAPVCTEVTGGRQYVYIGPESTSPLTSSVASDQSVN